MTPVHLHHYHCHHFLPLQKKLIINEKRPIFCTKRPIFCTKRERKGRRNYKSIVHVFRVLIFFILNPSKRDL